MVKKSAMVMALGCALWIGGAWALGLGDISVKSKLNERFSAVIPLTDVGSSDAEDVSVQLGSSSDFTRAGVQYSDYLRSLSFAVDASGNAPHIVISSSKIAREPFLSFLVDVNVKGNHVLREYTVLLDPPDYSQPVVAAQSQPAAESTASTAAPAGAAAAAPAAVQAPVPVQSAPQPEAQSETQPQEASAPPAGNTANPSTQYGPVKPGETLWSIAAKLRPNQNVSMDQVLLAIYRNNRESFDHGRIQGLMKGSMLQAPGLDQINAVSPEEAKTRVKALYQGHAQGEASPRVSRRHHAAEAPIAAPAPAAESAAVESTPPAAEPPPAVSPAATQAQPAATETTGATAETKSPSPAPSEGKTEAAASAPQPQAQPQAQTQTPAQPAETPPAAILQGSAPGSTAPAQASPTPPASQPATSNTPNSRPDSSIRPTPQSPPESPFDGLLMPVAGGIAVLLLGLLAWRFTRRRSSANAMDDEAKSGGPAFWKKEAPSPGVGAAEPKPAKQPARLGDTLAAPAAPLAAATKPATPPPVPAARPSPPAFDRTVEQTAQLPSFDSTQLIDTAAAKPGKSISTDNVDFDVTGKFQAETVKIDLGADDPLAEADFHLAYGLYDEAALLLTKASAKEPKRNDLKVKLAETYFRAGKALEFQEVAEPLKSRLSPAEWQNIAIMGRQLAPEAELFKGAGEPGIGNVDLAFDEPAHPAPAAAGGKSDNTLDFKLEDFEEPILAAAPVPAAAPAAKIDSNTLQFDLSDFDAGDAAKSSAAAHVAPAAAQTLQVSDTQLPQAGEIKLEDFDLGELPADSHAISAGDEAATKLDLARAYVDMGDNEAARTLLSEVSAQGSAEQKKDAEALLKRIA